MRYSFAIIILTLAQFSLCFDLAAYKKQYQAAIGDPYQNAATVLATNIIEYLAVTPVPTTTDAASQMTSNLISQAQSFTNSLNTAATSSDALKLQLDKESHQQIAANEQQLQQTSAQIQQVNQQVADMQNQVNAASKSVQDASNDLNSVNDCINNHFFDFKFLDCIAPLNPKFGCDVVGDINNILSCVSNRAQQNVATSQQRLTSLQTQLTQLQASLTQLNQQMDNLQKTKAGLEASKGQQQTPLNQARDNLNIVSTKIKAVAMQVALVEKNQVLVDVVKNLIDTENVITPFIAIADLIAGYTASAYDVNYLNILKQKIQTNLPLVQQKLKQFASVPPLA